tara:strand:- start:987 stop:1784 length:798 start_codon:yes stop_codon:yes gene_type:complete
MTRRLEIIAACNDEVAELTEQIKAINELQLPESEENIQRLLPPAAKFDKTVADMTIPVNALVQELKVLTDLINPNVTTGCGSFDGDGNAIGEDVSFDVVQGGRNDCEDLTHVGDTPYSTGVYGPTTDMTTGTDPTTIITGNLGKGIDTRIGATGTFLAIQSDSADDDGNACEITSGDPYDTLYPGFVNTTYAARRTALLGLISAERTKRDNYMNSSITLIKAELLKEYVERWASIAGIDALEKRKVIVEGIKILAEDPNNESYFA